MSLLIFTLRRQQILVEKSKLNLQLLEMKQKLMDLQTYAANIADGTVSMNDLMTAPASMFGRMSIFMQSSHQIAMTGAQQNFGYMSQIPGAIPQMQDPQMQQMYAQMMFKNLYDQEREKFSKVETKQLNLEDTRIQQEIARIETRLKMLEGDEGNVKEAEEKGIKDSMAKYA